MTAAIRAAAMTIHMMIRREATRTLFIIFNRRAPAWQQDFLPL
jgi:hypothetical protein